MTSAIDRRTILAALGGAAMTAGAFRPAPAQAEGDGLLAAMNDFLQALTPEAEAMARFTFGDSTHRNWNFMGTRVKPGLPIERMDQSQKAAADRLLRSLLSSTGYERAMLIMACQDVMREMGRGPADRNSERFSIAVFGQPAIDALWGVRIEGHHLSLSWTLIGNELGAITPASFSVIPQHIPVGARKGTVVLDHEEAYGRRLIQDLTGSKRQTAVFSERLPGNVMAQAGQEQRFTIKEGIAAAELGSAQLDLLWELIEITTVDPWPSSVAEAQKLRIREGDPAAVHFAWAGGLDPGDMFYYRIHGDTFVLEFTNVLNDPEHLHAIYHDPERTLGRHLEA